MQIYYKNSFPYFNPKTLFLWLLPVLSFFSSCEENITLDLPEYKAKLAVYCILQTDSLPTLYLNESKSYFDYTDTENLERFVKNALVVISDDAGNKDTLSMQLQQYIDFNGNIADRVYYRGNRKAEAGRKYFLFISHEGRQVNAETKVPEIPEITRTEHKYFENDPGNFTLTVYAKDIAGEENYYKISGHQHHPDPGNPDFPSASLNTYEYDYVSDQGFEGAEVPVEVNGYYYQNFPDDTASVAGNLIRATKETGRYFFTLQQQHETTGDPFSEPVIIQHNVTGGLGIFGAISAPQRFRHRLK